MDFLKKIQNWPESKRKIILWSIVIIISLILFIFWFKNVQQNLKSFPKEELKEKLYLPAFKEKLKEMPKFEMPEIKIPEISEEELKKLEESLREGEETKLKTKD